VPKAAGCTVGKYLTTVYGVDRVYKDYVDYPMNPLSPIQRDRSAWRTSAADQIRSIDRETVAIHGHFVIEKYHGYFPRARRIAWVRHPASWVISLYYFWKNRPIVYTETTNPVIRRLQQENLGLLEFAEDPTVRDVISRIFLGGLPPEEYDFLGVQEHMNDDLGDLARLMGWPEFDPGRENRSPEPAYDERLREIHDDPRVIERLVSLNEGDMALYETVLGLRSRRIEARQDRADQLNPRCVILAGMNVNSEPLSSRVA
jgi:hypothetical protein